MTARRPRLVVAGDALDTASGYAEVARPNECGGLLIGFRHAQDVHVERILRVEPSQASSTRLVLTKQARERILASALEAAPSRSPLGYVGTWHSHLRPAGPSPIDRHTLRLEGVRAADVVAMLVLLKQSASWQPAALIADHRRLAEAAVDVVGEGETAGPL